MHQRQQIEKESFEADVENSKLCSQATCRRLANHCSTLMDALVIFKTWFIQRQDELAHTGELCSRASVMGNQNHLVPYGSIECTSSNPGKPVLLADTSLLAERDWAVSRMRRMDNQMIRLRTACLAMRSQLEAGLRHKSEAEQVKRDLEMAMNTVSHYQNIINEGNKLRDDLRSELARARKDAAIARAQQSQRHLRSSTSSQFTAPAHASSSSTREIDSADTAATTMLSLTSPSDSTHLRSLLEHQNRWCESLNKEVVELRSTVHRLTEAETEWIEMWKTVQTYVRTTVDKISALDRKRSYTDENPFGSVLSLQWLASLAEHLHVTLPDNLANISVHSATVSGDTSVGSPSQSLNVTGVKRLKSMKHCLSVNEAKRTRKRLSDFPADTINPQSPPISKSDSPSYAVPSGSEFLEQVLSELNEINDQRHGDRTSFEQTHIAAQLEQCQSSSISFLSTSSISDDEMPSPVSGAITQSVHVASHHTQPSALSYDVDLDGRDGNILISADRCDTKQAAAVPDLSYSSTCSSGSFPHTDTYIVPPETSLSSSVPSTNSNQPSQALSTPTRQSETCIMPSLKKTTDSSILTTSGHCTYTPKSVSSSGEISNTKSSEKTSVASPTLSIRTTQSSLTHSMKIDESEDVATRVLTCPSGYTHKSRSPGKSLSTFDDDLNVSDKLLSLLESTYSSDIISWFDRITSHSVSANATVPYKSPLNLHTRLNLTKTAATAVSSGSTSQSPLTVVACGSNSSKSTCPIVTGSSDPVDDSQLIKLFTAYLKSKNSTKPSNTLTELLCSRPVDSAIQVLWSTFLNYLTSIRPKDMSRCETRFLALCSAVLNDPLSPRISFEWLLSHLHELISPLDLVVPMRCAFRLLNATDQPGPLVRVYVVKLLNVLFTTSQSVENFRLMLLPHIVDACHSLCWHDAEPLRDAAASQLCNTSCGDYPLSFISAVVQALLAWYEAYFDKCATLKKAASNFPDMESVIGRLHTLGWLPGARTHASQSRAVATLALSQQNYRIRCLALRLVDACLQIYRNGTDVVLMNSDSLKVNVEASCALRILLCAMAFVTGDDAVILQQGDDDPSRRTHQRKRRNRRTEKQQLLGLLGWILTGRLIPWLVKEAKSLRNVGDSDSRLLYNRLAILTTDVLMIGSHLVSSSSASKSFAELRSLLFTSGRRIMQLLEQNVSGLSSTTIWTCSLRLLSFAPLRCMSLVAHCDFTKTLQQSDLSPSYLWGSVDLNELFNQSLTLIASIPDIPESLLVSYKKASRNLSNSNLYSCC